MADLGRAALVVCLGLSLYALVAGSWALFARRRRLAVSAQNALVAAFASALVASRRARRRDRAPRLLASTTSRGTVARGAAARYLLSSFWASQEGSLLLWLLVLTGFSALVVLRQHRRRSRADAVGRPAARARRAVLRVLLVRREPFETQLAPRRRRARAVPAEPVHGHAPAAALPRLRRLDDPVRVRDGARSPAAPTGVDRPCGAGRSCRGRRSASACCSAPSGPTRRSAGAASSPGTRSRTPR